jgi:hypothetical protein
MAGANDCLACRMGAAQESAMTQGAVIFAVGNAAIDYVAMAAWSARRIERFLKLPTTLITDQEVDSTMFDQVIRITSVPGDRTRWFSDLDQSVPWHNLDRCDAYDLSPYDRTLLLDADYVINSERLRLIMDHVDRFWCYRHAYTAGVGQTFDTFGRHQHPMSWATVMMFGRGRQSEFIFDSMRMIRDNWQHYRDLYHIDPPLFRNDYALSIALPLVNGHVQSMVLPGAMMNVMPEHRLSQVDQDVFEVAWSDAQGRCHTNSLSAYDFHAMCKRDLGAIVAAH